MGSTSGIAEFCAREARACLEGIFYSITDARWLSDPFAVARAEKKPFQLGMAGRLGFRVPRTIISNQPSRVREFAKGRQLVAKAVSSGFVQHPAGNRAIFTSAVPDTDLEDLDGLGLAPAIFQELIPKSRDIRVTVVGQQVFAAEILSQERASSRIDWRATDDPNLEHRPHVLPESVEAACRYLVRELGLRFGAIDLALTMAGDYVFFEINPNGEWAWIEDRCGYPISQTIATFLENGVG